MSDSLTDEHYDWAAKFCGVPDLSSQSDTTGQTTDAPPPQAGTTDTTAGDTTAGGDQIGGDTSSQTDSTSATGDQPPPQAGPADTTAGGDTYSQTSEQPGAAGASSGDDQAGGDTSGQTTDQTSGQASASGTSTGDDQPSADTAGQTTDQTSGQAGASSSTAGDSTSDSPDSAADPKLVALSSQASILGLDFSSFTSCPGPAAAWVTAFTAVELIVVDIGLLIAGPAGAESVIAKLVSKALGSAGIAAALWGLLQGLNTLSDATDFWASCIKQHGGDTSRLEAFQQKLKAAIGIVNTKYEKAKKDLLS